MVTVVVAAALLAACGDDDGGGDAGLSVDGWCALMDRAKEVDTALSGAATAEAAQLETSLKLANDVAGQLVDAAPSEIADDMRVLADSTKQLDEALAAADYKLFDADLTAINDAVAQAQVDEAQANLDAFSVRECGEPFGNSDSNTETPDTGPVTSGELDLGEGTIREQLTSYFVSIGLSQTEAECLAAQADPTDSDLLAGDSAAVLRLFEECGISPERLAELGG